MGKRWAQTAFSGEGARLAGGRWNSKGFTTVYLSSSLALAALELLVHIDHAKALSRHVAIPVDFDERLVEALDEESIPEGFPGSATLWATRQIGDAWFRTGSSVLLRVPSAVVPMEFNYLYNPSHPRAGEVQIGRQLPFSFDKRLVHEQD